MRPKSVIHAERIYFVATAIPIVTTIAAWPSLAEQNGALFAVGIAAFVVGLYVLLILLTTRRANRIALWLLVSLTALGVLTLLRQIAIGTIAFGWEGVLNTVQVVLTVVGAVLLFRPNARAWFAREHEGWAEDA